MQRKAEDYTLLFGPEIGLVGSSLKFPKGVVTGVQLETVLRKLSKVKGYQQIRQPGHSLPGCGHRPRHGQGRDLQGG